MVQLPPLITDLAIILLCAGVMTLIFKRLKQPLVLGYIVAGFIASPYFEFTPSVTDINSIKIWADIGVIFLLFSLGLEFSFKKLLTIGSTPIISATVSLTGMMVVGLILGAIFGWGTMDSIYLGGGLAIASTSIIVKTFDDLGVRKQRFAGLVFSVLILEDIIAIVLMLLFSTMAASKHFEGMEMLKSMLKLVFFLILWFVVGIYLIPSVLKRVRKWISDEMLLIVSLSMCFGMVVFADKAGFSAAFGAFVMGSILAETIEAERIERLVRPIKDLFGAIFFVSVGMMIDPAILNSYWLPIVVITLSVLLARSMFSTLGFILGGQPLQTSVKCGFSLAQVGEFAFILASLGVSLGAISPFLYPIIVSVSVITTFFTPYMVRMSTPVSIWMEGRMPMNWKVWLERYSASFNTVNNESKWRIILLDMLKVVAIYSVLNIALSLVSFNFLSPVLGKLLPERAAAWVGVLVTLGCMLPFLRPIIMKRNYARLFLELWNDNRLNRFPLLMLVLARAGVAVIFIVLVIRHYFNAPTGLMTGVVAILLVGMVFSSKLKKQQHAIEKKFLHNLSAKELMQERSGEARPKYAGQLTSKDIHLADFTLPALSTWAGKTLIDLGLGRLYDIHVASVIRGEHRINIPSPHTSLFPGDILQVIGTDEQLAAFAQAMEHEVMAIDEVDLHESEMNLRQLLITDESVLLGKSVLTSGLRSEYRCMLVGVDRGDDALLKPTPDLEFLIGDVIWIVGERSHVNRLMHAHKKNKE